MSFIAVKPPVATPAEFIQLGNESEDEITPAPAPGYPNNKKSDDSRHRRRKVPKKLKSVTKDQLKKFERGETNDAKAAPGRFLKSQIIQKEKFAKEATVSAAKAEILLPELSGLLEAEGMEKTYKFTQQQISSAVDVSTARKIFDLNLDTFGPYNFAYSRNGRQLLLGGRKGHLATFDWKNGKLGAEFHVKETVRDTCWLHNETMFAVAQKRIVYIYDHTGAEVHALDKHIDVNRLEFLPYHFLLTSVGNAGYLKYQDTSTGRIVAELRTKLGPCDVMRQNPYNAMIHLGHKSGAVTLWTPNMSSPAIKSLCHRGPVLSLAVDNGGYYMATSGLDGFLRLWDIRQFKDKCVRQITPPKPVVAMDISQRDMLATAFNCHVQVWQNPFRNNGAEPYMSHSLHGGQIASCRFAPYEDVLGIGHTGGFSSVVIPGAGEPNFDTYEANPFQTSKQRQESEVKALLDKIQPELISLDPNEIVRIDRASQLVKETERREREDASQSSEITVKNKAKGGNSSGRRFLRKKILQELSSRDEVKKVLAKKRHDVKRRKIEREAAPQHALDRFKLND